MKYINRDISNQKQQSTYSKNTLKLKLQSDPSVSFQQLTNFLGNRELRWSQFTQNDITSYNCNSAKRVAVSVGKNKNKGTKITIYLC